MRKRTRYIGWIVLKAGFQREEKVAEVGSEAEGRELAAKLNATEPELHWCEYWSTTSVLSSEYGGENQEYERSRRETQTASAQLPQEEIACPS